MASINSNDYRIFERVTVTDANCEKAFLYRSVLNSAIFQNRPDQWPLVFVNTFH